MRCKPRRVGSVGAMAAGVLGAVLVGPAAAGQASHYWQWGWGTYGSGLGSSVVDIARFDWSFICFGNEPADQRVVDWCNAILQVDPTHKFVIRVWPIGGLGDCPENHHQATFLHYLYKPGVKEALLKNVRTQIELIVKGLSKPENVMGSVFLEELPGHFSACPFRSPEWKKGDPLPWDIQRFQKEVEAELGGPFDWAEEKHRAWWGRRWVQVMDEIHKTMKEASGGRTVIYYQATGFPTLDYYEAVREADKEGARKYNPAGFVPIHYADVVKPGFCDGIFGYPNNKFIWETQTQTVVKKLGCLMFSQISMPPGMRLCTLDEMAALARWEHPGNLGGFLFPDEGRKTRAWNELPYQDDAYWTWIDHMRHFGWQHKIGLDLVARCLAPQVQVDYSLKDLKKSGFVHVQAIVHNPRHPSWYGGRADLALLKRMRVTLQVPEGFSIPPTNNAGPTLDLGDLGAGEYRAADWWVRLDKDEPTIPAGQAFRVTASAEAVAEGRGTTGTVASSAVDQAIACLKPRVLGRSGETWMEPAVRLPDYPAAVELQALAADILFPELVCGGYRRVVYRDVLSPNTLLRIGPGPKAALFAFPVFDEKVCRFSPHVPGPDGLVTFDKGYGVFGAGVAPVRSREKYKVRVTGRAKDGNLLVIMRFSGRRDGKPADQDFQCFYGGLTEQVKTIESAPIEVPRFDGGTAGLRLYFYRIESKGTLYLQSFECRRADIPEAGLDVSARLEGILSDLIQPLTVWTYKDLSDPVRYSNQKIRIRFLSPEEVKPLAEARP